jgi:hypothetical protein
MPTAPATGPEDALLPNAPSSYRSGVTAPHVSMSTTQPLASTDTGLLAGALAWHDVERDL